MLTYTARNNTYNRFNSLLQGVLPLPRRRFPSHAPSLTVVDWFHSLPLQRFQALLTLFSKSFSPFLHSTCLLSVSDRYLAFDAIYHQLCAPLPRNTTLQKRTGQAWLQRCTGFSPSLTPFSNGLTPHHTQGDALQDYNPGPEGPRLSI